MKQASGFIMLAWNCTVSLRSLKLFFKDLLMWNKQTNLLLSGFRVVPQYGICAYLHIEVVEIIVIKFKRVIRKLRVRVRGLPNAHVYVGHGVIALLRGIHKLSWHAGGGMGTTSNVNDTTYACLFEWIC